MFKLWCYDRSFTNNRYKPTSYADDIALIAGTESDMQAILDLVTEWCNNCNLQININKSKVMHFRKHKMKQSLVISQLYLNVLVINIQCM